MSQSSRSKAATQTRATRNLCTWQIQLGKSSSILFNCSYLWLSVAICSSWQHVAQQHHSPTIFYCGQVSSMIAVWKLLARQAGFPRASLQFTRFHQHISCSPIEGRKKTAGGNPSLVGGHVCHLTKSTNLLCQDMCKRCEFGSTQAVANCRDSTAESWARMPK